MTDAITKAVDALKWFIDELDGTRTRMVDFDENVANARAALTALQEQPAPVAWMYEMSNYKNADGDPMDWSKSVNWWLPNVPADMIRNVVPLAPLSALHPSPARDEAEALVKRLREKREDRKPGGGRAMLSPPALQLEAAAFIARHHLGEKNNG